MRRINNYPMISALTPVRRVRRPETYEREPREGECEPGAPRSDNDKPEVLDDNRKQGGPGSLIDDFA